VKNIPQNPAAAQARRTNPYQKQPYEDRVDKAPLYPARNKREPWQSDLAGVVRLSATGARYWVNLWSTDGFRLRLSEKDGPLKTPVCRLSPVGPGRYTGELLLSDEESSSQFLLRVWLHETDQRWLEVHFEVISQKENRKEGK
jgi:hypothetical protein